MQSSRLTLLIPQLISFIAGTQFVLSPALRLLLARANTKPILVRNPEQLLFSLFNLPATKELPVAAVTGLVDGLSTQQGYWLRADPVELQADLAAVYFLGGARLQHRESEKIVAEINRLLVPDGLTLYTPHPQRWYLKLDHDPDITTFSPSEVLGKNIHDFLPQGAQQAYWRKWLTEMQMLLHPSIPGQPNALWLWGGGRLPAQPRVSWQGVGGNDVLVQGLAHLAEVPLLSDGIAGEGERLVALQMEDSSTLEQLETDWFAPLVAALRNGKLAQLNLYGGNNRIYSITSRTVRYFWRSKVKF